MKLEFTLFKQNYKVCFRLFDFVILLFISVIFTMPFWLLWNDMCVDVFNANHISIMNAWKLCFLIVFIFGKTNRPIVEINF